MSSGTLTTAAGLLEVTPAEDPLLQTGVALPVHTPVGLPHSVRRRWLHGTSALTVAVMVERGTGLLANVLAARLGGAAVFGSYSVAISTANNIGTYAAGGIGATATRFSGKYPHDSAEYGALAKALAVVALTSATVAILALCAGAAPLAHLLGKPELASLLRWASLSAAGMIVLECARGFFVGQQRIAALLLLSLLVGAGLLLLLPMAAHAHSPTHMVLFQSLVCGGAVIACLLLAGPLALRGTRAARRSIAWTAMLREVWSFGFIQLSGMVAANLAGWWLTTLVSRADTTLAQVGFFAIASQMRNLAGVIPGLLTEGSYAVMAAPPSAGDAASTPHRVMALSAFASLLVSSAVACVGIVIAPWFLRLLYGSAYTAAAVALAMALALAVAHMGNATASARLTIVSIRTAGIINTAWALFVAAAGTAVLFRGGAAWQALAILLAAHLLSAMLVLQTLQKRDGLPRGMRTTYCVGAGGSLVLAVLAIARAQHPAHALAYTLTMLACAVVQITLLLALGKRHHWLPSMASLRAIVARVLRLRNRQEVQHV